MKMQTVYAWLAIVLICFSANYTEAQCVGSWIPIDFVSIGKSYDGAMVYDSLRDQYILFGGFDGVSVNNHTRIFDPKNNTWTQITTPTGLLPRVYHSMVYDSNRDKVVLFGGYNGTIYNDTWEFSPSSKTWQRKFLSTNPRGRMFGAMAYDSNRRVSVLFGGTTGITGTFLQNEETWEYDSTGWKQKALDDSVILIPSARTYHAMTYNSDKGYCIMHGGYSYEIGYCNDTWAWNGSVWTKLETVGDIPLNCKYHSMVYDEHRHTTVLMGMEMPSSSSMPVFEIKSLEWKRIVESGPASRSLSQVIFDQYRSRVVLFGGFSEVGFEDMWYWVGPNIRSDINQDGQVGFDDYLEFLSRYDIRDPSIDFTDDGEVDFSDYLEFLSLYESGC